MMGGGGEEGGMMAELDPLGEVYENLPPLEKLERYFQSEDVLDRYIYATYRACKTHLSMNFPGGRGGKLVARGAPLCPLK